MEEILHTFGINWKLLIAQTINFVLLLVLLSYFLYKPLMAMVAKRQALIEKGVKDAAAAADALAHSDEKGAQIIAKAETDASALVKRAKDAGEEKRAEIVAQASARAQGIVDDAAAQAKELERAALAKADADIAKLAILATEKMLRQKA